MSPVLGSLHSFSFISKKLYRSNADPHFTDKNIEM